MLYLPSGQFAQLTPREKGSEESKKIEAFRECFEDLPVGALTYGTAGNPQLWDNPKPPFSPAFFKQMAGVYVCVFLFELRICIFCLCVLRD